MFSLYADPDYVAAGYDGYWLEDWLYAAEITVWNGASEIVRYFSSAGFVTTASDTPAHTAFEPRIQQPALMRRDVFGNGQTFGASRVGYGELVLANNDGGLDSLINQPMDGRRLTLRAGKAGYPYPAAWITVLTATMDAPGIEWNRVSIRLRDRLLDFQPALQATLYAGDNALPSGLEGTEDDLKDQPKPLVYGTVANVAPPMVNTSRLIYQVNDGPVHAVTAVYDRGVALTQGAAYGSQAEMETDAPTAGGYRVWAAGGYFRLGSSPVGVLTADVTQGASEPQRTAAQVMKAIALRVGVASGDIVSGDVAALDAANSATVGLWLNQEASALAAMDAVANSIGAWWGFDALGRLRMARMTAPSGTPVARLDADAVQPLNLQATATGERNVPPSSVEVRYARNHTVQTEVAGSVTEARKAWLKEEWRSASADAASVTVHPLAEPLIMDTLLVSASAASAEATRRATLFGQRRDRVAVTIRLDSARLETLDLGAVVQVTVPRFGYDAGKLFRIIGIETDLRVNRAELTLWG